MFLDLAYILPMGYSPALETEYIAPCKYNCECSTLKSARRYIDRGETIPSYLEIESRRYIYSFSFLPYKRKELKQHPYVGRYEDCVYLICTGCQKPASQRDAEKINRVLGFQEPVYEVIPLDLDGIFDYDF